LFKNLFKQQIDSRLCAIISFHQEELSKLFVYGHTNMWYRQRSICHSIQMRLNVIFRCRMIWLISPQKWKCVVSENIHTSHAEGIFSNTSPPLWKFQLIFTHFFKFLGHPEPPTPQEIPIPSVGGVWIFSGTAQSASSYQG